MGIFVPTCADRTVADTCLYYFFLELATRWEYKVVPKFTTHFKNISNAFEKFETCTECSQRISNISNVFWYLQRVWNILNLLSYGRDNTGTGDIDTTQHSCIRGWFTSERFRPIVSWPHSVLTQTSKLPSESARSRLGNGDSALSSGEASRDAIKAPWLFPSSTLTVTWKRNTYNAGKTRACTCT